MKKFYKIKNINIIYLVRILNRHIFKEMHISRFDKSVNFQTGPLNEAL